MPILPSEASPEPRRTGGVGVGALVFAVPTAMLFVLGWKTWATIPVGVWHDDGAYVLIAESLAAGGGLSWFGVSDAPPAGKFPPLYPVFLSILLRNGVTPESGSAAFALANIGFVAAAGGVFALFLRRALGFPSLIAIGAAVLLWMSPRLWALAAIPLSEPLFLLALTVALFASLAVEGRLALPSSPKAENEAGEAAPSLGPLSISMLASIGFFAAFAAGVYTRTVGVVVGAAIVGVYVARGAYREAALLLAGVLAVLLPWMVWASRATAQVAEPLRDVLGGYSGWLAGEVTRNPFTFVGAAFGTAWRTWSSLTGMLVPGLPGIPALRTAVALVIIIPVVIGLFKLSRRSLTSVLFVALYFATIAIWPFQSPRLAVPLLPWLGLALGYAFYIPAGDPENPLFPETRPDPAFVRNRRVVALMGILLAANYATRSAIDLVEGNHLVPYQVRADALQAAVQSVNEFTAPHEVVGAPELWAGVQIHAHRTVAPSARFLPLATDGPSWGTPAEQFALWDAAKLDFIVVEHGGGVHGDALDRLDAECPGGAVQIVALLPNGFLVRLAWDEACKERVLR